MSYGGYEYGGANAGYGGFDPLGGGFGMGGGFVDEGMGGGAKSTEKKNSRERQSLVPVTIKQFNEATFENELFRIDGCDLNTIKIVGVIESVEQHSTNILYRINDGTGICECKQWIEKDSAANQRHMNCRENTLVHVFGNPRDYEGRRHLLVYEISVVTDWNELTHHLLETIYIHLQNTKGPLNAQGGASGGSMMMNMGTPTGSGMKARLDHSSASSSSSSGAWMPNSGNLNTMRSSPSVGVGAKKDDMDGKVFNAFRASAATEEGYDLHFVLQLLQRQGTNITPPQLKSIVDKMTNEGILYSTIDENHYKPTDEHMDF